MENLICKDLIDGVDDKWKPVFIESLEKLEDSAYEYGELNKYVLIEGKYIMPKKITVVEKYSI